MLAGSSMADRAFTFTTLYGAVCTWGLDVWGLPAFVACLMLEPLCGQQSTWLKNDVLSSEQKPHSTSGVNGVMYLPNIRPK